VKNITKLLLLPALVLLPMHFCAAQTPLGPRHAPDGGTRETFASIFVPSMPDAPFTATVNTEWIRQLPDGSNITLKNHRTIARDAHGRVFQERRYFVPDDGKHESTVTQIEISDPATHQRYVCRSAERVCHLEPFFDSNFASSPAAAASPGKPGAPGVENLGTQTIAGLEAIGTRETSLIEAATIGNESPILEKREFWYSPRLGVNLITRRQDSRFATQQNFEVANISLGEPDAKLFELPSGFQVIDQRLRKPPETPSPSASPEN
jgi:hypothetical protein